MVDRTWKPDVGELAFYNGKASTLSRSGFNVKVVAEARSSRLLVEAIGRSGCVVRFTVKSANLKQPQPDLFILAYSGKGNPPKRS